MSEQIARNTRFLNVDLYFQSQSGVKTLLDALGNAIDVMSHEKDEEAWVEIANKQPETIDEAILLYHDLIQVLPPAARAIWDSCESRCFNIGIQGGDNPHQVCYGLSAKTISLIQSMRAEVAVTVYGTSTGNFD